MLAATRPIAEKLRYAFLAMATLALALRLLVPVGFMVASPAVAGGLTSGIPIILCTAQGNITAFMGADGSVRMASDAPQPHEPSNLPDHSDCVFGGGVVALASLGDGVAIDLIVPNSPARTLARLDQCPGRGLAAPPPPATASPDLI